MPTTTIPLAVTADAAARVAELGMDREFEAMLEHSRQFVPGLRSIAVSLEHDLDQGGDPGVVIWAHREEPGPGDDPTDRRWAAWKVETFSPHICIHFVLLSLFGAADGR